MKQGRADNSRAELLAYLSGFVTGHKLRVFEQRLRERTRHFAVVLEDIYRSHNASACLRSCDAFGVQDVHIIENRYRFRPNKDIERGSARWLTLHRHDTTDDNTPRCITELRERGYRIVAMCPHPDATPLEEFDVARPAAFFFGTEMEGLTATVLESADERVRIPTWGFAESLNLSVAVAVAMHHLAYRLRQSDVEWRLPPDEADELMLTWVRRAIGPRNLAAIESAFRNKSGKRKADQTKAESRKRKADEFSAFDSRLSRPPPSAFHFPLLTHHPRTAKWRSTSMSAAFPITEIVLASRNRKKSAEIDELLRPLGIHVRPVSDFPDVPDVVEDGDTFAANAAKKAGEVAIQTQRWAIGEDSGLRVDALGGEPGVYSARYAGEPCDDAANNAKLVAALQEVPPEKRTARYVCNVAVADPSGTIRLQVEATCRGRIVDNPRGTNGFGYDPHFLIPELHRTFGELPPVVKRHISHRARAFERLLPALKRLSTAESG